MDDQDILSLYTSRDERAVAETAAKYGRYCETVARHILTSHEYAEECVNDTWLRAWNSIPPACPQNLGAYLAKITRRLALDRLAENRAEKRGGFDTPTPLDELADILPSPDTPDSELSARALTQDVDAFLRTLPARTADIFVLRYFFGEPVGIIAARRHMTPNTVSALLSRTRKKLKTYLKGKGYSL